MIVKWMPIQCWLTRRAIRRLVLGELQPGHFPGLERHLARCSRCQSYQAELEHITTQLHQWASQLPAVNPPRHLQPRWRQAILTGAPQNPVAPKKAPGVSLPPTNSAEGAWQEWLVRACHAFTRPAWGSLALIWLAIALCHSLSPRMPDLTGQTAVVPSARQVFSVLRKNPVRILLETIGMGVRTEGKELL